MITEGHNVKDRSSTNVLFIRDKSVQKIARIHIRTNGYYHAQLKFLCDK